MGNRNEQVRSTPAVASEIETRQDEHGLELESTAVAVGLLAVEQRRFGGGPW